MSKAKRSGIVVHAADVPVILGMVNRGDRKHDIAAWFGLNQGRIAEVEDGAHGTPPAATASKLPPSGSPGPRARALRAEAGRVLQLLKKQDQAAAIQRLEAALTDFDQDVD
jgi:hypothetical protein